MAADWQSHHRMASCMLPQRTRNWQLLFNGIAGVLGVSVRHLDDMVAHGRFPAGVRMGRGLYWAAQVVDTWRQRTFAHQLR